MHLSAIVFVRIVHNAFIAKVFLEQLSEIN